MPARRSEFRPLLFDTLKIEELQDRTYRKFIRNAVLEPGIRLLLKRHRLRPDWPYIDTKFNPNTGANLPGEWYETVHTWVLGRGTEALAAHLTVVETLDFSDAEIRETRQVFDRLMDAMKEAILQTADRYDNRCPFRLNRDLEAIDSEGRPEEVETSVVSGGDIFCGKALLCSRQPARRARGDEMLLAAAAKLRQNRYVADQFPERPRGIVQGGKMLFLAVPALLARAPEPPPGGPELLETALEFLGFVLRHHYDAESGKFSETLDPDTLSRGSHCDPGHCHEYAGLGLGALDAVQKIAPELLTKHEDLVDEVRHQMPGLFLESFRRGFNPVHEGIYKLIDLTTGEPLDSSMPWWNLPETMRAALRVRRLTSDDATREACLEVFRKCHNAYFAHYLNRQLMLFPYQTRCGETGRVVDRVPGMPEGDPLYHSNVCFLEMLDILDQE